MSFIASLVSGAIGRTLVSLSHNWPYLLAGVVIAGTLGAFVDADKVGEFLARFRGVGVAAATAVAVGTPLCSCGTTAVVLGMMASTMPWAPIVAFMVASPLSSPEGIAYAAGLFGWPFALFHFLASIVLGLAGGGLAAGLQKAGLLENQARFAAVSEAPAPAACACAAAPRETAPCCRRVQAAKGRGEPTAGGPVAPAAVPGRGFPERALALGSSMLGAARMIVPMFLGFAFLGYLLNGLIPAEAIGALFGEGRTYGVPLAATIGLPLYVNAEASMPLARALLDSGMSRGAIMAFLIAGSGTSIGAIGGALTIARWRVVGLVIALLWTGAVAAGYVFNLLSSAGLL